jgi:CRISPR-associated protein Csb2
MGRVLLLSVRFHDGRYHGAGDWPPSPARLFQALVAGAARGHKLSDANKAALGWLETLGAPVIAAPMARDGQGFTNYVPNNDLDAVGGDPGRVGEIRAPKIFRPRLFDAADPLLYAWNFEEGDGAATRAQAICTIAERLYQLGRGVDMAWACGEILFENEIDPRLARHGGVLYRPTHGGDGAALLCPQDGSLASLDIRFRANRERFSKREVGPKIQQLFSQAPKPRFAALAYDSPPQRFPFDLRGTKSDAPFAPWPLKQATQLIEAVRNGVAERLKRALPGREALIERVLIGRGATEADKAARVRIVPLPSIGHAYADHAIRRVLVEIPPNCPISTADIAWGFSGLEIGVNYETGEVLRPDPLVLSSAEDRAMFDHYGIEESGGGRLWRTVTPAALPQSAARRRIDPSRIRDRSEQKGASERLQEQDRAVSAVVQALRHTGIGTTAEAIRVQREPFEQKGERAEAFADATRFRKEQLWHVEVEFADIVRGPLVIGDGRYLGLGLMAPVGAFRDAAIYRIDPATRPLRSQRANFLHAVRRALMARARDESGGVELLFSGHESDGTPARRGRHGHVFIAAQDSDVDGHLDRLIVVAPWRADRTYHPTRKQAERFESVSASLTTVRAGALGVIALSRAMAPEPDDHLFKRSRTWLSLVPYRPNRHPKRQDDPAQIIASDLCVACTRRGFPQPKVEIVELNDGLRGGVHVKAQLTFSVAVEGPLMLGRDSHAGGGLFTAV